MQGHIHFPSIIIWTLFNEVRMRTPFVTVFLCHMTYPILLVALDE